MVKDESRQNKFICVVFERSAVSKSQEQSKIIVSSTERQGVKTEADRPIDTGHMARGNGFMNVNTTAGLYEREY